MVKKVVILSLLFIPISTNSYCQNLNDSIVEEQIFEGYDGIPVFSQSCTLEEFIQNKIDYPSTALKDSIEGNVYVAFNIKVDGSTSNHRIVRGIREDLNREALRITRLIKFEKSAGRGGRDVEIQHYVIVKFELPKNNDDYW